MAETSKRHGGRDTADPAPIRGATGAARRASRRLENLTGHPVDGVSAVSEEEHGWRVAVDVLEVPRIPDTTSLMATYEVDLDQDGKLLRFRRVRRYRRAAADD
ncbi:gas vesicle protein [Streptomyces sp. RFCAC02]|uniref:gas vesicle protein GvpO n=1 Tax=Streptomyces sp. RFCAC02 TaxID=2499143 RepID=UPI001F11770A|nr:gas vesicle protein [Streptomyces sp. RFCAC02]